MCRHFFKHHKRELGHDYYTRLNKNVTKNAKVFVEKLIYLHFSSRSTYFLILLDDIDQVILIKLMTKKKYVFRSQINAYAVATE